MSWTPIWLWLRLTVWMYAETAFRCLLSPPALWLMNVATSAAVTAIAAAMPSPIVRRLTFIAGARRCMELPLTRRSVDQDASGVDLRALQAPGVVDVDRLPLREDVERGLARLAVAVARVLRAAEREMHFRTGRAGVDVRDARLKVAHRAERLVHVARKDRRREPVANAVCDAQRLVEVGDFDECGCRPEDLFLRNAHPGIDVAEHRRPVEEPSREIAVRRDLAAGEQLRAFVLADLRVRVDLLDRRLVDDGPDIGGVVPAGTEPHALRARDKPLLQLLVDARL